MTVSTNRQSIDYAEQADHVAIIATVPTSGLAVAPTSNLGVEGLGTIWRQSEKMGGHE